MSQAKVDRYKEQKANRKEIMKKNRRKKAAGAILSILVIAAALGWVGRSAYLTYESNKGTESISVDYSALDDFYGKLEDAE